MVGASFVSTVHLSTENPVKGCLWDTGKVLDKELDF